MMRKTVGPWVALTGMMGIALLSGCATVKVQAPDKPIEINLNVKIEQDVRVRLDKDVEDLIQSNPDIF
ncbi:YnbE family lipoprotein [Parvularcula sp. LCG005]|uniref:YnbE family lipoprotein n=1 Tax=Parvularcula sp. LCG005 TaxID=3078805 RepID=UPI002941FF54|nr:YnbE family lipoprotein [Parvularcula sp. LCG005]WOI52500.1 YnbE family lipoprotein [Parvularcula sp. LCG005]